MSIHHELGSHDHHHHHGHSHSHSHDNNGNKTGLWIALIITAGIMVLEFIGGILTNSLALLSDAGHMLSDTSAILLSLFAIWLSVRPVSPQKTYGYYRVEILAALFNGASLFIIAGFIFWEAYKRFLDPPVVASGIMMLIAAIGLMANLASAWFLMKKGDVKGNLNVRSAYLHILGDALGSIGAIAAGLVMLLFGWYIADPMISVLVSLLILRGAWGIMKHSIHILLEGTPIRINQLQVKESLENIDGVLNVHDLHIWTITSGLDSISCHLLIADHIDAQMILQEALHILENQFKIKHATIQIENSRVNHEELKV